MAKRSRKITANKRKDLLTYVLFMAWPTLQFVVFYIGVNLNSILLSFKSIEYDKVTHLRVDTWVGLDNIIEQFQALFRGDYNGYLGMSIASYLITVVISIPLGLFFSYYIYKKFPLSGFFRVILFLPSILSAVVTTTIFKNFADWALPVIVKAFTGTKPQGFVSNPDTLYPTIMFYNILVGFGTNVLMYSNRMSGISPEISEAAAIDGAVGMKEFWHITLPQVYPTLIIFVVTGFGMMLTNQFGLFSFYKFNDAPINIQNLGYYFYNQSAGGNSSSPHFPKVAALGVMLTVIIVPITLGLRYVLNRFGPSEK